MPTYTFREQVTNSELIRDVESLIGDSLFIEKLEKQGKRFFKEGDQWFTEWTEICSISEMEEKETQGITVLPASPFIGDPVRQGLKKPSDGFRDILRNIKKKHKGGKRNDNSAGVNTF